MPRYKVVKQLPAIYTEMYEVDAGSEEEASNAVKSGKVKCSRRAFETTPKTAQPAGFPLRVIDELVPVQEIDGRLPSYDLPSEFNNARFMTQPGNDAQYVAQYDLDW